MKFLLLIPRLPFNANRHSCTHVIQTIALALIATFLCGSSAVADFELDWQGDRRWTGEQTWATPLWGWQVKNNRLEAIAAPQHLLSQLTHQIVDPQQGFQTSTTIEFLTHDVKQPSTVSAGFSFGIQGLMDNYRHVLSGRLRSHSVGVQLDGRIVMDGVADKQPVIDPKQPFQLRLTVAGTQVTVTVRQGETTVERQLEVPLEELKGNLALFASSAKAFTSKQQPINVAFGTWKGSGAGLVNRPEQSFGPILWSQYMIHRGTVKLLVQMAPIGSQDNQTVDLKIADKTYQATIEPMSRTALFRVESVDATRAHAYEVVYRQDEASPICRWPGTIRAEPEKQLRLAAFSCDHGYAFPQPKLVKQVQDEDPDMLFFAGDQIYENYGGLRLQREPLETATLDYLRKYIQFGWTWRELLKDRPSVIIPDDHDVFQGNIWGQGGRPIPKGGNIQAGGYVMPPAWINMVQRTQTANLPDAPDNDPVEQGIGVYFTEFKYGGVPFIVLEDRKFKTGPDDVLPEKRWGLPAKQLDVDDAQMLGKRQEAFLQQWSQKTANAKARVVLSQTIFCKASTHTGKDLKKSRIDFDCNGWPQTARDRALNLLQNHRSTIMVHGDQHFGILLRHGVDKFDDGPLAFMVPGTANGYPRAWWPESGEITGNHLDGLGNKMTVIAAANPEKGSNKLNPRKTDDPELTAYKKGSGYGLITIDLKKETVKFDLWRYPFRSNDESFEGFPKTIQLER
ncbi:MAG: alkaline phosphatase D family protein [Planctomycetota bacterium]